MLHNAKACHLITPLRPVHERPAGHDDLISQVIPVHSRRAVMSPYPAGLYSVANFTVREKPRADFGADYA